ncbi:MAG TPA: calcium-binding protein, partial [Pseudolabrys sp.]|nr:calcium-binding protein [Pseudolabrys sp.]
IEWLYGSYGNDTLTGDGGDNLVYGDTGNDTISGGGGNDTLNGGAGSDIVVFSGKRADYQISYDTASSTYTFIDTRAGSPDGTDSVAGFETYRFSDGDVTNIMFGTSGNDAFNGTSGNDLMVGLDGSDVLIANEGNDVLLGGDGNDALIGGSGADVLNGGSGNDWAMYLWDSYVYATNQAINTAGVTANLANPSLNTGSAAGDTYIGIEWLYGSYGNDTLTGDGGDNLVYGDTGNDTISGGGGNDTLNGGAGNDTLNGGAGYDIYQFGRGGGQDGIVNGIGAGTAAGELDISAGVATNQLWLQRSGNDLLLEIMGSQDRITVAGWYSSPSAQLQKVVSSDGSILDTQIDQLVQAMATYSSNHAGFDPATTSQAPNDTSLQSTIAAAWHQ